MSDPIVIVSAARTPIGSMMGEFSSLQAYQLGSTAIKAAVERAGLKPHQVQEVIMGCCLPAGQGLQVRLLRSVLRPVRLQDVPFRRTPPRSPRRLRRRLQGRRLWQRVRQRPYQLRFVRSGPDHPQGLEGQVRASRLR